MGTLIATIATVVIAVFTALVWKISKRMEWLTGAMESHSALLLRMEAENKGIAMEWWDPSIEDIPGEGQHREPCKIRKIYVGLHPRLRKNETDSLCYQLGLFVRDFREHTLDCWDAFLAGKRSSQDSG